MQYQVFEIPFGHLTDREQMRRHFFSVGRLLLDRERAREIRDQPTWFDAPLEQTGGSPSDSWQELLDLLDPRWHGLATGLRAAGIVAPRDVDGDILIGGRVSGQRAVMMWDGSNGPVLLTEDCNAIAGYTCIAVTPDSDQANIAQQVRDALGEAG